MRYFFIGLLMSVVLAIKLNGQNTPNNPDWMSYQHYLSGRWDSVIVYGHKALSRQTDHYFLRMRLGIANFFRENYMAAAYHFEKALKFEPQSYDAKYYLFRCYQWTNRSERVDAWLSRMNQYEKNIFAELDYSWLRSIDVYTGAKTANQRSQKGSQQFLVAGLSHAISSRTYFYHQLTFFQETISRNLKIQQFQFYTSVQIPLTTNLLLQPAFHYTNLDDGYNQFSYLLKNLTLRYDYQKFTFTAFGGIMGSYQKGQTQFGAQTIWYPSGNLNQYYSLSFIMHRDTLPDSRFAPVISMLGGIALSDRLWLEAEGTFGKRTHFFESSGSLIYNSPDVIYEKLALKPMLLIGSEFILYAKGIYEKKKDFISRNSFHHITFLGGFTWNFSKRY